MIIDAAGIRRLQIVLKSVTCVEGLQLMLERSWALGLIVGFFRRMMARSKEDRFCA